MIYTVRRKRNDSETDKWKPYLVFKADTEEEVTTWIAENLSNDEGNSMWDFGTLAVDDRTLTRFRT
jgi:hypothetical protein